MTLNTCSNTLPYIEQLYDDYLYDCYVANQRLSEDDWFYYGRELHHVVIPDRDKGELTELNSQALTTYQHWVAGVLQSELLGKTCFAFIPREVLPEWLEQLRRKWHAHQTREVKPHLNVDLSARNTKVNLSRWGKLSPEERSAWAERGMNSQDGRAKQRETRWGGTTPEERSEQLRNAKLSMTPEARSAAIRKGWETRRRNAGR